MRKKIYKNVEINSELFTDICISHQRNFLSMYIHRALEAKLGRNHFKSILEIGGNIGEHVTFVKNKFNLYILSDIDNSEKIYTDKVNELLRNNKLEVVEFDCEEIPYKSQEFERVILTCVLPHLRNPEDSLIEVRRVVTEGGLVSILIPCDPGILYRFLRNLTSLQRARRYGVLNEAKLFHAREHRNHFMAEKELIDFVFRDDKIELKYFPFRIKSWNLNVFAVAQIRIQSSKYPR
jgi:phosphatidylethanolamine/phosphatidyl-N-methylethanolamine N-methyltransferase